MCISTLSSPLDTSAAFSRIKVDNGGREERARNPREPDLKRGRRPNGSSSAHCSAPLPLPICACAIEIDQNIARLGAFARPHEAAVLQFIHDAGGASIAEAKAALEQRDAGFLLAANDFNTLLNQFFVFIAARLLCQAIQGLGKLLMDFHFITGFALFGVEIDNILNLLILDQRALRAD